MPDSTRPTVASIGILGGGTAGLLAALALRRAFPELSITLIAARSLGVIGVGEATTPLLPQFLHVDLGLDLHRFFAEVQPTLKLGIRLEWGAKKQDHFNYPFGPIGVGEPWCYDRNVLRCSPRSMLMSADKVPIFETADGWESGLDPMVGYHLDNERFVSYLEGRARRCRVRWLDRRIVRAKLDDGQLHGTRLVTALVDEYGEHHSFDLYLDASGFRTELIGRSLESPFTSYEKLLPTDRAVVAKVPNDGRPRPYTLAQTWSSGWCWNTPQRHEDHRGYVYSSEHASSDQAVDEMHRAAPGATDVRSLQFQSGRRAHFWLGNVVALGNAYGFVEPLESTALHMLIRQIGMLLRALSQGVGSPEIVELNQRVGATWDYLAWFLALHYRFNHRLDTAFWRDCRGAVDVSAHSGLLDHFATTGPLSLSSGEAQIPTEDPLWGAEGIDLILLGQGVEPGSFQPRVGQREWRRRVLGAEETVQIASSQDRALLALDEQPELLQQYAEQLSKAGPAFLAH